MSKTLIAYFSRTGITKALARAVSVKTGSELIAINPAKTYSSSYLVAIGQAKMEHLKNERPLIMGKPHNLESFDNIVIMFPIWWFTCPNIILSFLEENRLTGTNIIPVCTYGSSGKGSSEQDMQNSCPNAKFLPCIEATGLKNDAVQTIADTILKLEADAQNKN